MTAEIQAGAHDRASWAIVAAMAAGCAFACHGLGFTVAVASAFPMAAGLLILAAAALFAWRRGRPRLLAGAIAFLQMTLFTVFGVVLSYALAARGGPLWDHRLAAADAELHLNWPAIFHVADASPMMLWMGGIAYYSLVVQMIVCIVALSGAGHLDRLRIAITAAVLSGAVTIAISGVMPAIGNLFDPDAFHHLWPSVAWQERGLVTGLRRGSARVLDLSRLSGIVSFPSYHATLPIILAWAQRDLPVMKVAAPIWAALTIVATPLFGGHYGMDVLAGLGLALAAIAIAPRLAIVCLPVERKGRSWLPMLSSRS
jgi:hypothetical protein